MCLLQNVYNQSKSQRKIALNSNNSVFFCNGREASQLRTMAYQIFSNDVKCLIDAFMYAISKLNKYLVLDHSTLTAEDKTVVSNILLGDQLTYYININAKVKRH